MQRHLKLILGLLLIAVGAYIVINATTGEAQVSTSLNYATPLPPEMAGKYFVVRPGVAIDKILTNMTLPTYKGSAVFAYTTDGKLFGLVYNGNHTYDHPTTILTSYPTAYVYEYDSGSEKFWELDCALDGPVGYIPLVQSSSNAYAKHKTIEPGMTIDTLINNRCVTASGSLDREAPYSFDEDLYYIGEQYFKDSLAVGGKMFADMIAQGTLSTTNLTSQSIEFSSSLSTSALDTPGALNCPVPKRVSGTNGIWSFTNTSTSTEHAPVNAFCVQADGTPAYMIEVWRFAPFATNDASNQYYKLGIRLYERSKTGSWVNLWSEATHVGKYTLVSGNPVAVVGSEGTPVNTPVLVREGQIKSVDFIDGSGSKVTLNYSISNDTLSITNLDASQRAELNKGEFYRLRFESFGEQQILDVIDRAGYNIYTDPDGLVDVYLQKVSNKAEGTKVKLVSQTAGGIVHFATPGAITEGKYSLIFSIAGAKEATIPELAISLNDLSSAAPSAEDIQIIPITVEFVADPCTKCENLQACFACVNAKVIEEYE